MSQWPSSKAKRVLASLLRLGWQISAKQVPIGLASIGWSDVVFAFHDGEEIGPKMLTRLAKHTGLTPEDL